MDIAYYIDFIPFILGVYIVLVASRVARNETWLAGLIVLNTFVFLLAQSAWFTSMLAGSGIGMYWSNYAWFAFNTLTMLSYIYIIHRVGTAKNGS